MSRIAKPIQGGGLSTITNTTTLQSRPSKIGKKESSSPSKKQTRFSSSPSLSAQDGESVPTNADAPTPQRRSLTHAAGHLPRETAHLSTSSADDLSETDTTARFSPSSKTSTPRSSWSRSPTQDSNNNNNKSGKKSSLVPGALAVGRRVTVPSMGLTGTLRFLGETSFKSGTWAGIELDVVGSGKNDGCVQGVRYFSCPPQTGLFILASKVVPEKRRSIQPAVTTTITNSNGNQTNESLILQQQQQQQQQQQILSATAITTTKRPSRQPVPTRTKSTVVSKRSKTLPPPPQKLTPSKTTVTRTSKKPSRPSRFSLPQQHPPTPPLPASVKRSSPDVSSRAEQQPQPQPPTPENNVDRSSATPPHTETPVEKPRMVPEEELLSIYELLERSQQEKDKLMEQMKSKEAAWERLVSTKESYALRIQEKEEEISRLQHNLEESRKRFEEQQLLLSERDEIIAKNLKEDAVIEQYQRRIEKLENMIEELTAKANETAEHHESKLKDHQGQVEQLRRALADRETLSATLEKECEELRTAGLEAIGAYEASVNQLKREKEELLEEKEAEIRQLSKALEDLKRRSLMLDDDQVDFSNEYADEWHDQRRRLEEQLEIATSELENERSQVRAMEAEADKLKAEIQRLHMASLSSEERLAALQRELEQELLDKRRLMEEADAAFEAQAKAEDENYQLKMARVKSERELAEAMERIAILEKQQQQLPDTSSVEVEELKHRLAAAEERNKVLTQENKQLKEVCKDREQECARLMDELLALENADTEDGGSDSIALRRQIEKLKQELDAERRRYTDLELEKQKEISHLNKELAELESLVESRVFGEGDMEQELENERKKVARLEKEIEDLKKSRPAQQNQRISGKDEMEPFCEICEKPGHDILNCTVLQSSLPPRPGKNSMYCANCDQYDVHSTEDCPNQDETF